MLRTMGALLVLNAVAPVMPVLRGGEGRLELGQSCQHGRLSRSGGPVGKMAKGILRLRGGRHDGLAQAPPAPCTPLQVDKNTADDLLPHSDVVSEAVAKVCRAVDAALAEAQQVCAGRLGAPPALSAKTVMALRTLKPLIDSFGCVSARIFPAWPHVPSLTTAYGSCGVAEGKECWQSRLGWSARQGA
jgi:hypothetical protein